MNKITLDFTVNKAMDFAVENQEVAIMPANKLLKEYARKLSKDSTFNIVDPLVNALIKVSQSDTQTSADAVQLCIEFIQERCLIEACANEQWEKFTVNTVFSH